MARQWPLIAGLGALALIRPIMSMLGLSEQIGQPTASITATIIISLVWIAIVVVLRVKQPVVTLLLAGVAYGVFAIVLSAIASPILSGQLQGPLTNPFAIVSVLLTNAVWGFLAGITASVVMRVRQR
ncbi:hypothetical protein FE784_12740 [Paenibacillus hemerocallicola]|uniref:Uncharacterized protein n=1 Tax=Paenibacillus hemerocallicola TaxID=1172614 RepID=A0A5C4TAD7_9BACL|nr:hypothetical protein FE784_12740 [Paenibacillus hemerocallicola]